MTVPTRPGWPLRDEAARPWALAAGEVHVYRLALELEHPVPEARLALLDADERRRARRLRSTAKRAEFALTRAALRRVLGAHLEAAPATLGFTVAEHGKPALSGAHAGTLDFNVSHSRGLALIAVARDIELGVDVEWIREETDALRIAHRFFSRRERRTLEALPPSERRRAFFRCWSRKEAVIKANGRGIGIGLGAFDVTLAPHDPPRLEATRWDPDEAGRWRLHEIDPHEGYAAALAAARADTTVRTWSLVR